MIEIKYEPDEQKFSEVYKIDLKTVRKVIRIVTKWHLYECPASMIMRIRCECQALDFTDYKHLLFIGHVIGTVTSEYYNNKVLNQIHNLCQRQN